MSNRNIASQPEPVPLRPIVQRTVPQEGHDPLVSILLATYNGELFLEEQINSLLQQDYPNVEIIACDDASQDGSYKILCQHAKKPNFHIHKNERNLGYVKNFEKMIGLAKGHYVAFCDQDDLWHKGKISTLVSIAKEKDCGMVYSDAEVVDKSGQPYASGLREAQNIEFVDGSASSFYLYNCVTGCTSLARKSLIEKCLPFPEGIIVHDWWLAYCCARIDRIAYTEEKLMQYRVHDGNQIGINKVSLSDILKSFVQTAINPMNLIKHKQHLKCWQKTYQDYFKACLSFEKKNDMDSTNTMAMIAWADKLDGALCVRDELRFFLKAPEIFAILPKKLRYFALLMRLWTFPLLNLFFCGVVLFWLLIAALVIGQII